MSDPETTDLIRRLLRHDGNPATDRWAEAWLRGSAPAGLPVGDDPGRNLGSEAPSPSSGPVGDDDEATAVVVGDLGDVLIGGRLKSEEYRRLAAVYAPTAMTDDDALAALRAAFGASTGSGPAPEDEVLAEVRRVLAEAAPGSEEWPLDARSVLSRVARLLLVTPEDRWTCEGCGQPIEMSDTIIGNRHKRCQNRPPERRAPSPGGWVVSGGELEALRDALRRYDEALDGRYAYDGVQASLALIAAARAALASGDTPQPRPARRCPICRGDGTVRVATSTADPFCPRCGGAGFIPAPGGSAPGEDR